MFEKILAGVVAWPTTFIDEDAPQKDDGTPTTRKLGIRYRYFSRTELRDRALGELGTLAGQLSDTLQTIAKDTTLTDVQKAERSSVEVGKLVASVKERDDATLKELQSRVLAFEAEPGKWKDFDAESLAKLLDNEPTYQSFWCGLNEASRGVRAKN